MWIKYNLENLVQSCDKSFVDWAKEIRDEFPDNFQDIASIIKNKACRKPSDKFEDFIIHAMKFFGESFVPHAKTAVIMTHDAALQKLNSWQRIRPIYDSFKIYLGLPFSSKILNELYKEDDKLFYRWMEGNENIGKSHLNYAKNNLKLLSEYTETALSIVRKNERVRHIEFHQESFVSGILSWLVEKDMQSKLNSEFLKCIGQETFKLVSSPQYRFFLEQPENTYFKQRIDAFARAASALNTIDNFPNESPSSVTPSRNPKRKLPRM